MNQPRVGLGVLIRNSNNEILYGKRRGSHGEGTWCVPGGHLEFKESWEECAQRETREETSIEIDNIKFLTATNDIFIDEDKHYITIFMIAEYKSGQVQCMEPDKCEEWQWFKWDNPPSPTFLSDQNLRKSSFDFTAYLNK